jgi:hypothetical protein
MAEAPLMGRLDFYAAMVRSNAFTRSALTVAFILLYRCQNGRTGRCNPSIAVLAQETGLPERSVTRALRELRESKWWLIRRGGEKGRGDTNNYAPQLERVSPVTPIRLEKGDKVGTKRVSPMTPKPVKNQERLSRSISSTTPGLHNGAVEQFEHFWQVYPSRGRHANPKKPAQQSFSTAIKRGADPADIVAGAEAYAAIVQAVGIGDPRFIPQAVTWLNQERWNDQPPPAPAEPPWPVPGMI